MLLSEELFKDEVKTDIDNTDKVEIKTNTIDDSKNEFDNNKEVNSKKKAKKNSDKEKTKIANSDSDNGKTEDKEDEEKIPYDESTGLDERIIRAVNEMGFEYMSPIQKAAIPVMMEGKDIIGQAQTGTGKTAAFGIPLLQRVDPSNKHLQAVVLCPTRELAMQAADDIRDFAKYMFGIKVLPIYGGQDISRQIRALSNGVQIVVGTPGRVMDHMRRHTLKLADVKVLVLDEADEMLDMGFREDIETILEGMPEERQTALFSATMPKPILEITKKYQNNAEYIKMTPKEITVKSIEQSYYRIHQKDKEEVIARLLDYYHPQRSLIFCNTKRMVDVLAEKLKKAGYLAEGLHGDLSQNQRDTVMNIFRSGRTNILIATDVAARGIDVSGVEAVFNFDIPEDIEYYVHRIGRTGRAGKSGKSFTLVSGREMYKLREIEKICHTRIEERKVPSAKEVTKAKSQVIFNEVVDVIENNNLDNIIAFINQKVDEGEYTVEQLAAGFMRLKMGEEIEEKDFSVRNRGGRDRDRSGKDRRDGRGRNSERNGRDSRGRRDGRNDSRNSSRYGDSRGSRYGKKDDKRKGYDKGERKERYNKGRSDNKSKYEGKWEEHTKEKKRSYSVRDKSFSKDKDKAVFGTNYTGLDTSVDKVIAKENKKKGLEYLQDVSDFVMESFGKGKKKSSHKDNNFGTHSYDKLNIKTRSDNGRFEG
ncbi:MAG: DEAD/DEAH box helicase [Butyrivibrio sp.]|nr:DEAD/DEAH box helicase [Butyrivibrio sp.]